MKLLRVLTLNLLLSALAVGLAALALRLDRWIPFRLPPALSPLGWLLLLPASLLIVWAVITLLRGSGATGAPFDPTHRLVTSGPYAWLRHPIYAADGLLLLGLALGTQSPGLLLFTLVFMLAIDRFVRLVEEPRTEARFGQAYRDYARRVPRWLPRILGEPS